MKFFIDDREITTIRADQAIVGKCYNASLEVTQKKSENKEKAQPQGSSNVMLVDLDARQREEKRLEPDSKLEVVQVGGAQPNNSD